MGDGLSWTSAEHDPTQPVATGDGLASSSNKHVRGAGQPVAIGTACFAIGLACLAKGIGCFAIACCAPGTTCFALGRIACCAFGAAVFTLGVVCFALGVVCFALGVACLAIDTARFLVDGSFFCWTGGLAVCVRSLAVWPGADERPGFSVFGWALWGGTSPCSGLEGGYGTRKELFVKTECESTPRDIHTIQQEGMAFEDSERPSAFPEKQRKNANSE